MLQNNRNFSYTHRLLFVLSIIILVTLTGCGVLNAGGSNEPAPSSNDEPPPLPTARPDIEVDEEVTSRAGATYDETWAVYLEDSIGYQIARQQIKLNLIAAYQNPDHIDQNTGGLFQNIALIEDRTAFDLTNNSTFASAYTDYDIRITYLDGDTETKTCTHTVQIELRPEDERWYVINPQGLDVYAFCG